MATTKLTLHDEEMTRWLSQMKKIEVQRVVGRSLFRQAHMIMRESKRYFVPVDDGVLRASGHVEKPKWDGDGLSVNFGYGGAASAYAMVQHQNKNYRHTVGTWQYLSRPTMRHGMQMKKQFTRDIRKFLRDAK